MKRKNNEFEQREMDFEKEKETFYKKRIEIETKLRNQEKENQDMRNNLLKF